MTADDSSQGAALPVSANADAEGPVAANYEAAVSELERLVGEMEAGRLDLEASLAAFERGSALLRYCQGQLTAAEQQVRMLEGDVLVGLSGDDHQD